MKLFLSSIGCRLNHSEIESLSRQLLAAGHDIVSEPSLADKVIVNSCAVTKQAAKDTRSLTRRIHKSNPEAEIILTGCYATIAPEELEVVEGAALIVANKDKDRLIQIIDPSVSNDLPVYDQEPILRDYLASNIGHTRAFVKVQDGCDNRCTFCVTTIARGQSRSRPLGDVVAEIQALVAAGYQETVLTGVHLGSYGRDLNNGSRLTNLISSILHHTDVRRLRISSLEPWDVPIGFFELWRNPRLLPHLHVPLQSGSDHVLRRMARRTTRDSFRQLTSEARNAIADLNLSTDLIIGFPGESEADFQDSLEFVKEIAFTRLHVFTYSQRPGTVAAMMDGQVPKGDKKARSHQMIKLGKKQSLDFHRRFEGRTREVLWEAPLDANEDANRWIGYTDNYIRVRTKSPVDLFNRITNTRLTNAQSDGISGTITNP